MNKHFSGNGCKQLWMAASDLGKYLTTFTIIINFGENI